MIRQIRRKLIARLALVALTLSVLSGAVVFFFEMKQIDDQVLQLALEESHSLSDHISFLTLSNPADFERVRAQVADHILSDHISGKNFIVIKMYDRDRKKVIDVSDPADDHVEEVIGGDPRGIKLGEHSAYRRFFLDGMLYIQVAAPITFASGEVAAYFEGIYRVDPMTMRSFTKQLAWSVLAVVIAIFITTAALYPVIIMLNRDTVQLSDDLADANMGMLEALGSAVSKRDRGTHEHNYRVTLYAIRLAEAVGLRPLDIQGLMKGAFLHDVGKIAISDAILLKPSRLTDAESAVMETHVEHGVDIIKRFVWLGDALDVVRCHHEKFDGTGYGEGLRGSDIPVRARIFAIVDVFDALTSKRSYREPAQYDEALRTMQAEGGTRFDPELLDRFMRIAGELHQTICLASDEQLVYMLSEVRTRYFPGQTDDRETA